MLPPFEPNSKTHSRLDRAPVPVKYLIVESKPERLGLGTYFQFGFGPVAREPYCVGPCVEQS